MKKVKILFLSMLALLFFQHETYAQLSGVITTYNDQVCTGYTNSTYYYGFTAGNISSTVKSVTIDPAGAGTVNNFGDNGTSISWNSSLTSATITVSFEYITYVDNGKKDANKNPILEPQTNSGTIVSSPITLLKPTFEVTGPTSIICTDPSPKTYTVSAGVTEVTEWRFTPTTNNIGTWVQSSSTTYSATFNPNVAVSGTLSVTAKNATCNTSTSTSTITINRPSIAPTLASPTSLTVTKGQQIPFAVNPIPNATSYSWSAVVQNTSRSDFSTVTQNNPSSPSASIQFLQSATYTVTVNYVSSNTLCPGRSSSFTVNAICPEPNNVAVCGPTQLIALPNSPSGYSTDLYPRFVQDINQDGFADLILFSTDGVYIAKANSNGSGTFLASTMASTYWAITSSWPNQSTTPRFLADVDGVNGPDIVGFASNGIFVSKNNGSGGFAAPTVWSLYGCSNSGWTNQDVTFRNLVDINQDGRADVVGFGSGNTFAMYAKADGTGFKAPVVLANCSSLSNTNYPSNYTTPRQFADMNYDGALDIVFFRNDGVYVALNKKNGSITGDNFNTPVLWIADFGTNSGYVNQGVYPRRVINMNNDNYPDIVAFGNAFVFVALGTGSGFNAPTKWSEGYTVYANSTNQNSGYTNMDVNPRLIGDITGDGLPDLIGFKYNGVAISKNLGNSFACPDYEYVNGAYTGIVGYTSQTYFPRFLANIDSDNRMELIGFYTNKVEATICNSTGAFRQGIDETEITEAINVLSCYPNPASDAITFKIANMNGDAHIVIFDGTGSKVKEITSDDLKTASYTLNTSSLLNGVYYYQYVDGSGNIKSDKFIIMK